MFVTVDLFEGKNVRYTPLTRPQPNPNPNPNPDPYPNPDPNQVGAVVRNLHSLGRVAQQSGVAGPMLGGKLGYP